MVRHRPHRSAAALACVAVLSLLAAACAVPGRAGNSEPAGTGQSPAPSPSSPSSAGPSLPDQLRGRTFLSTSVTGHQLVPGSRVSVGFEDGRMAVSAGCNGMSGQPRWDGARLSADDLAMTAMGCEQALMDQDDWFAGLLRSGVTVGLHGDVLTLTAGGVTMQLVDRRVADPDRPLQGTVWTLTGIVQGTGDSGVVSSVPQGIAATLRIADGKIHFFDGLNDYDGPTGPGAMLNVGPDTVTISGDMAGSGVGCASGQTCSVDMSVLMHDFTYQITAGSLTVTGIGATAGKGLMFTAEQPGGTSTSAGSGSGTPNMPAPTGPAAAPGTVTGLPPAPASPSLPGGHDSIPPQPSPAGPPPGDGPASSVGPVPTGRPGPSPTAADMLVGKSFRLTGLFTDAGGVDTRYPDRDLVISFAPGSADAETSCGHINYLSVRYYADSAMPMVDLGTPEGARCSFGSDPEGPPSGQLMVVIRDGKLFLSTGFVGWWFEPTR